MIEAVDLNAQVWPLLFAATGIARLWYAVPLVTSVSLVCAATRHEAMGPILIHAAALRRLDHRLHGHRAGRDPASQLDAVKKLSC